jgi:hypothetical protein
MENNKQRKTWEKPELAELPIGRTASGSTTDLYELFTIKGGPKRRSG